MALQTTGVDNIFRIVKWVGVSAAVAFGNSIFR